MIKDKREKIFKTFISFIITFLIIFITVVVLRALTLNVQASDNKAYAFFKDYFDVMRSKTEVIASKLKIKSDNVSEYQRNLISQSVNDYTSLLKYQTYEISKDFNPNIKLSPASVNKYKENFYKMILENPYIMSITFFNDVGVMKLNMFSVKGITIELSEELRERTRNQGSIFLHAENENALYTIMYMQNEHGSFYVATRNDYVFVSDLIAYYQIPENSFMVTDSYNVTQRIEQNDIALMSEVARENISSIIGRYAYYKQEPAFSIDADSSLMVSMVSKNYPNYFELLLISFTALMIVIAQNIIMLIISLVKKTFPLNFSQREDIEAKKAASIINKSIIDDDRQLAYEGLSLDSVLSYNENMKNESPQYYTEKSTTSSVSAVEEETIRPFGTLNFDEEDESETIDDTVVATEEREADVADIDESNINGDDTYDEQSTTEEISVASDIIADADISAGNNAYYSDRYYDEPLNSDVISEPAGIDINIQESIETIPTKEVKKYNNRSVDDIFASFDNLLESIISKADQNNVRHNEADDKE